MEVRLGVSSSLDLRREWQRGQGIAMELARLQKVLLLVTLMPVHRAYALRTSAPSHHSLCPGTLGCFLQPVNRWLTGCVRALVCGCAVTDRSKEKLS